MDAQVQVVDDGQVYAWQTDPLQAVLVRPQYAVVGVVEQDLERQAIGPWAAVESGRVARVGYVTGVGTAERTVPRRNLTGDPYFTDGLRAVAVFADMRTNPTFLNWM